ncbi:carboxypeptidase-like regulatory domain-containing protein [uncultured Tenacibaculum sp.]|uniref:carboxypeptidase-like regulatory domain-containing protein n=1 Tax=uncultured Tenacibaculum sp. TaxID=174713 RepID=UPI0026213D83|nr:carboxypeptidase-like regulatory domain-containing protein [uncultured Tenacibaculum sp.]
MSNPIYGLACPQTNHLTKPVLSPREKKCGCMKPVKHPPIKYGDPINNILKDYGSLIIDNSTDTPFSTQVHIYNLDSGEGTVTDANGQFIIQAKPTDKLKISHVGFGEIIVVAKDLTDKVVLNESNENLDEVIIGSKKKSKNGVLALFALAATFGVIYLSADDNKKVTNA